MKFKHGYRNRVVRKTHTAGGSVHMKCLGFGLACMILMSTLQPARAAAPPLFINSPASPIAVGNRPTGVVTGDFNGDGKADVALVSTQLNQITVLLGDGNGAFSPAQGSPFSSQGTIPETLIAKDFNKDGKIDLAVLNVGSNSVRIFLGDGTGKFTAASAGPTAVGSPGGFMAAADFNGDGVPDLAVSDNGFATVIVLISDGAGGFTPGPGSPFSTGNFNRPTGVVTGDFNKDGKTDIAVASAYDGNLTILLGDGAGGFTPQGFKPVAASSTLTADITALATGDFYNRGTLDILAAATGINQVGLLKGDGVGSFSYQRQLTNYQFPVGLIVADFDGDGNQDAAVITNGTGYLNIFPGNGAGNFNSATGPYFTTGSGTGSGPSSMASADFDGDGKPDIVVTNNNDGTISVFLSNGPKLAVTPTSSAPSVTQVPQTISFTVTNHLGSDQPFPLTATASSGLPVTFSVLSGPATISGNTLTLTGVGTVTVEAKQDGNYSFLPAISDQPFTVALGAPAITSVVNSASFAAGVVPSNYYATIFGNNLAVAGLQGDATSSSILGGTSVTMVDSAKRSSTTNLWFVSYGQANFVVPSDLASGPATVTLTNSTGKSASFQVTIGTLNPGVFSVDGSGSGYALASVVILRKDAEPTSQVTAAQTPFGPIPVPIPMVSGTQVYLILSGTGIRGRSSLAGVQLTINGVPANVLYAGPAGGYPALDQLDALIPAGLAGTGTVKVQLTVDGVAANAVTVKFQ